MILRKCVAPCTTCKRPWLRTPRRCGSGDLCTVDCLCGVRLESDELSSTLTQKNVAQLTKQMKTDATDDATVASSLRSKPPEAAIGIKCDFSPVMGKSKLRLHFKL